GSGTQVVQENQEAYLEAAWQQVGKVLEGNQRIRYGQMAMLTTQVWHAKALTALRQQAPERFLAIAAPVQPRLLADGLTIRHQIQRSALPATLTTKTVRQAVRPRGRVDRLVGFDADRGSGNLLDRVNRGEVSAAPPKVVAPQLPTGDVLADYLRPRDLPRSWVLLLLRYPWLRFLPVALALLVVVLLAVAGVNPGAVIVAGVLLVAAAIWLARRAAAVVAAGRAAQALDPDTRTPESVDQLPASPDFRIAEPGTARPTIGTTDSADAVRFKESLRNAYAVDVAERTIDVAIRRPLSLPAIAESTLDTLRPERTVPPRVLGSIGVPSRIRDQLVEDFGEVMVYPEIDVPMYEPLKDLSSELFLPNVQLVENNSITLLESNQKFIESYLVGLNHEFARELLWREYPTDQRGSYFRQFWDVRGFLAAPDADPQALRERLRDIPELHTWSVDSGLGSHDHREAQGDKEEELVLVIRGELLKKYPTAVVYAHRAAWERTGDGGIDKSRPRKLWPLTDAEAANPPRALVKSPLYEAKVEPDIYFFGFDLTAEVARGGQIVDGEEDPGWFFILQERPGEPRFGLDLPQAAPQPTLHTWNDLAWTDVLTTYEAGGFLRIGERTPVLTDPGSGSDAKPQYDEDRRFFWRPDTHAAELAYILFQVPVLMAVHAAEMLRKPD
ncbi:MAG TPA: hypothetical protein VF462_16995, partial [Micromonosporaceae bacterium]